MLSGRFTVVARRCLPQAVRLLRVPARRQAETCDDRDVIHIDPDGTDLITNPETLHFP